MIISKPTKQLLMAVIVFATILFAGGAKANILDDKTVSEMATAYAGIKLCQSSFPDTNFKSLNKYRKFLKDYGDLIIKGYQVDLFVRSYANSMKIMSANIDAIKTKKQIKKYKKACHTLDDGINKSLAFFYNQNKKQLIVD